MTNTKTIKIILHKAIKLGHEMTEQCLLDKGANINSCEIYTEIPPDKANKRGREITVNFFFLNKGSNIFSYDKTQRNSFTEGK